MVCVVAKELLNTFVQRFSKQVHIVKPELRIDQESHVKETYIVRLFAKYVSK